MVKLTFWNSPSEDNRSLTLKTFLTTVHFYFTVWTEYDGISTERNSNELMGIFHLSFHHIRFILYLNGFIRLRIPSLFHFWHKSYIFLNLNFSKYEGLNSHDIGAMCSSRFEVLIKWYKKYESCSWRHRPAILYDTSKIEMLYDYGTHGF